MVPNIFFNLSLHAHMHMQRRIASVFHLNFKSAPRTLQWRHAGPHVGLSAADVTIKMDLREQRVTGPLLINRFMTPEYIAIVFMCNGWKCGILYFLYIRSKRPTHKLFMCIVWYTTILNPDASMKFFTFFLPWYIDCYRVTGVYRYSMYYGRYIFMPVVIFIYINALCV